MPLLTLTGALQSDACASYGSIPCDATSHPTHGAEQLVDGRPASLAPPTQACSNDVHKDGVPMTEVGGEEGGRLAVSPSRSSGASRDGAHVHTDIRVRIELRQGYMPLQMNVLVCRACIA